MLSSFLYTILFFSFAFAKPSFVNLAIGPAGTQITKFTATFKVPPEAGQSGFHAIWPGLLIADGGFLLQSVVDDQQGQAGKGIWQYAPWYGPDGSPGIGYYQFTDHVTTVQPGDFVTTTFSLDSTTDHAATWSLAWAISGSVTSSSSVTSTLSQTNSKNPFSSAGLFLEFQQGGRWTFGEVEWTNLEVTMETEDGSWCNKDNWSSKGYGSSPVNTVGSEAVVSHGQGTTTCFFDSIIFHSA